MKNLLNAHSIGIIGGADGPTAFFVTVHPTSTFAITVIALALAFIGFIVYNLVKKKKR